MRRPETLLWSLVSGLALIGSGGWLSSQSEPPLSYAGYPPILLGAFVVAGGLLTAPLSPPSRGSRAAGEVVFSTAPTQRVAGARSALGALLGIGGVYGVIATGVPLGYPSALVIAGAYLYATGVTQLWRNRLTRYYVTRDRVIETYQLLGVTRKAMPRDRIQGIEENKTALERLLSVGYVRIESAGDTGTSRITARNITDPTKFVRALRTA